MGASRRASKGEPASCKPFCDSWAVWAEGCRDGAVAPIFRCVRHDRRQFRFFVGRGLKQRARTALRSSLNESAWGGATLPPFVEALPRSCFPHRSCHLLSGARGAEPFRLVFSFLVHS